MAKVRVTGYTFDASAQTITFTDYTGVSLDGMLLITNVTDQIIIYNFADTAKGGTVSTNVLTLEHDTTSMADADDLLIYYDDPETTVDLADNLANPIATAEASFGLVYDGSTWDRMRGDSTNGLTVNLGSNNDVTVSGVSTATNQLADNHNVVVTSAPTTAVTVSSLPLPSGAATNAAQLSDGHNVVVTSAPTTAITAVSLPLPAGAATSAGQLSNNHNVIVTSAPTTAITASSLPLPSGAATSANQLAAGHTVVALGNVADNAVDSGNPVKVGAVAVETDGTTPGTVAEGDRADLTTDLNRRLLVNIGHPDGFRATETHVAAQTSNTLVSSPGVGAAIYLTDVFISNGAVAGTVKIQQGASTDIIELIFLAVNGGASISFNQPMRLAENQSLGFTSATVTTHSVTVVGFVGP